MNPLYRHIEHLLLSHPCVVIPQFGAFVTMNTPACYVEREQFFFPPVRNVRFNADITADDGLLVSAVAQVEVCSLSEAKKLIQTWVLDLRQQLLTDSQVEIDCLGTLEQDEDGNLSFEACQSGITFPAYFGLDAFSMPQLSEHSLRQQHQHHTNNDHITIHIHKRTLRTTIAIAACVILCAIFSEPITENVTHLNWATLFGDTSSIRETAVPQKLRTTPIIKTQETPINPGIPKIEESSTTVPSFAIVVASATTLKNAEAYATNLQKRGFTEARIDSTGKVIRVIIAEFSTETAAYNFNHQLHDSNPEFASSWVLSL